ncbi:MAG TPA: tyrosine--tRNA ligase, partial [Nannocystaceae bacterium]|nr:tyrosine--tRNA ligase [Nannocystaceae bacterium]
SDLEAIDRALAAGPVTFYIGFDPTAPSLHVGSLLQIMAMRLLQRHGHRPIALMGGGTAMVGDPSGKTEMRKLLGGDDVRANSAAIAGQFARFLSFEAGEPNDALMLDNAEWLLELRYIDFLREIGRHFTVNRMVAVKTYRDRLDAEIPLSFLEFNYQLLQAYDFLHLFRARRCTLQIGGSDQWGNMIAGVELIRRVHADDPQGIAHCLTLPLLTTADGKKMGKTERGAVWLAADRVPPFEYYQFWIGVDDRDVAKLLRLYTELPLDEIADLTAAQGSALRLAKARLAFEATRLLHGEDEARKAEEASRQAFGGGEDWSAVPLVAVPAASIKLVDLVVDPAIEAFKSKREARQRIEDGAVKLNGEPVTDPNLQVTLGDEPVRLQAGKKIRLRVIAAPAPAGGLAELAGDEPLTTPGES